MPILALSVYDDDDKVFNAICAGASGYLLKNTAAGAAAGIAEEVVDGGAPMSPEVARRVVDAIPRVPAAGPRLLPSDATGDRAPQAAWSRGTTTRPPLDQMGISINTVSFHLKNIYEKLQVHSKTEAVAKALREHLI